MDVYGYVTCMESFLKLGGQIPRFPTSRTLDLPS